ncbi:hypothetical protein D3C85_1682090 [compost metagenome]
MTAKEQEIDTALQELVDTHNVKIKAIYDRHQNRAEWFQEIMRLMIGGYVVLYLLVFSYEILSRLPPYVQP